MAKFRILQKDNVSGYYKLQLYIGHCYSLRLKTLFTTDDHFGKKLFNIKTSKEFC